MNGSTAVFIYDGKNILEEIDKDGTRTNIYGSNIIATTGTDEIYYQYNNHGDVIRVSDRTGTLLNEYVTMSKGVDFVLARKINTFANANTEPIGDVIMMLSAMPSLRARQLRIHTDMRAIIRMLSRDCTT